VPKEPIILQMNISHYSALLELDLDDEKRAIVQRLLAEAEQNLALARRRRTT
jgi:hypothetical protein